MGGNGDWRPQLKISGWVGGRVGRDGEWGLEEDTGGEDGWHAETTGSQPAYPPTPPHPALPRPALPHPVLAVEGAQWDVLPALDVAGTPVVHQHVAARTSGEGGAAGWCEVGCSRVRVRKTKGIGGQPPGWLGLHPHPKMWSSALSMGMELPSSLPGPMNAPCGQVVWVQSKWRHTQRKGRSPTKKNRRGPPRTSTEGCTPSHPATQAASPARGGAGAPLTTGQSGEGATCMPHEIPCSKTTTWRKQTNKQINKN